VRRFCLLLFVLTVANPGAGWSAALVFQSDFGVKDGAVASMKGVAYGVRADLKMFDLTHEIPAYSIWEAAYRLKQTAPYWPAGTVFVSVVDPGVGTDRESVVLKTKTGHYFVTPDNGTLTFVAEDMGVTAVRQIDEAVNRRRNSDRSYTFHGRDVYAYTGARLAAGVISFEQVGKKLAGGVVRIAYQRPHFDGRALRGTIPVLDPQYGNVWTNIDRATFAEMKVRKGEMLRVTFSRGDKMKCALKMPYVNSFGDVPEGKPLAYLNSLLRLSFALNMDSFAKQHGIGAGAKWNVDVRRAK